jgi:hypothetical protein
MPITWCLADPKLGEREICLDLLTIAVQTGLLAPSSTVLADKAPVVAQRYLVDHQLRLQVVGKQPMAARLGAARIGRTSRLGVGRV